MCRSVNAQIPRKPSELSLSRRSPLFCATRIGPSAGRLAFELLETPPHLGKRMPGKIFRSLIN